MNKILFNSIRNKFDYLIAITKANVDVLMTSETKLDDSFLYNMLRSDRNTNGGVILVGSRKKSLPEKGPPYTKPNPIPNLTVTLTLTPHGGIFSRGIFS